MKIYIIWILLLSTWLFGCSIVRDTPKYTFSDGYYAAKVFGERKSKVYVDNSESSINVYIIPDGKPILTDTTTAVKVSFPIQSSNMGVPSKAFKQSSFDIDFLTIPFKYRPPAKTLPPQFNTNLNGAVYLGFRTDFYQIWYKRTALKGYKRQITHYGFSFGIFNGLGGTAMNPWVTQNHLSSEYDGVVWSKGITGIIGVNNFTLGLAFGWDHLFDKNKEFWIYQGKPWLGLAFGLNLN